jgi:hypothetical protein
VGNGVELWVSIGEPKALLLVGAGLIPGFCATRLPWSGPRNTVSLGIKVLRSGLEVVEPGSNRTESASHVHESGQTALGSGLEVHESGSNRSSSPLNVPESGSTRVGSGCNVVESDQTRVASVWTRTRDKPGTQGDVGTIGAEVTIR